MTGTKDVDKENRMCLGQSKEGLQEGDGARVDPVQIIDTEHQRSEFRCPDQELTQVLENQFLQGFAFDSLYPFRISAGEGNLHQGCHEGEDVIYLI